MGYVPRTGSTIACCISWRSTLPSKCPCKPKAWPRSCANCWAVMGRPLSAIAVSVACRESSEISTTAQQRSPSSGGIGSGSVAVSSSASASSTATSSDFLLLMSRACSPRPAAPCWSPAFEAACHSLSFFAICAGSRPQNRTDSCIQVLKAGSSPPLDISLNCRSSSVMPSPGTKIEPPQWYSVAPL